MANFPIRMQVITAKTPNALRMKLYDREGRDLTIKFYVLSYDMASGRMGYMPKESNLEKVSYKTVHGAQIKLMP